MSSASLEGRTLGKYEIVGLLGRGGMASVYKGYQADVDRHVAIKVLPPHPGQDAEFMTRFRLEARTVARLQHPNILPLYDYGMEGDILYLVMPFIEGGSLSDRIKRGRLPMEEIERIVQQVASALDYAHAKGIVHRDVKPDNILLMNIDTVMLADFGIVKMIGGGTQLTTTGGLVGTPAYIAPEQLQGLPITPQVDVYSLGIVTYQMLAGELPYTADTPIQVMLKHMSEPVPDISKVIEGIAPEVGLVMQRVLAKEQEARYATAGEFAADLSRAMRGQTPLYSHAVPADSGATRPEAARPLAMQPAPTGLASVGPLAGSSVSRLGRGLWVAGAVLLGLLVVAIVLMVAILSRGTNAGLGPQSSTSTPSDVDPTAVSSSPVLAMPDVGQLSYSTTVNPGDTVSLRVGGLPQPGEGQFYAVWLVRTSDQSVQALGRLALDAFGDGVLSYSDPEGRMLPTRYNGILITEETVLGSGPTGEVRYSGYVPQELADALNRILVQSDTGDGTESLLAGAIAEAAIAAQHAGLASGSSNLSGRQVHAEHTINILLGQTEDLNRDGRSQNPGHGTGVIVFLDQIDTELSAATEAAAPWPTLQGNVESIRVCVANVRGWVSEVVDRERQILSGKDFESTTPFAVASTEIMDRLLHGFDLNESGGVDPFEGECGLDQIASYGVLVGSMTLLEGPPPA